MSAVAARPQGEACAGRPVARTGPVGALVLGHRQGAARPRRGADLDRPDRGRRRLAGGGASVIRAAASASPPLYYFYRQLVWIALAVPVMIGVSMLGKTTARRLSIARRGRLHCAAVPGAGDRLRGERRAALARRRLHPVPAVRIPEAAVHRHHRLAAVDEGQGQLAAGGAAVRGADRRGRGCC